MPSNTPAFWSAVAAMFAALTSLLVYLTMRRSLLDSARPEIVLKDWDRLVEGKSDAVQDKITFQTIRNVGPGAAYHIRISASGSHEDRPTVVFPTAHLPILAPNEEFKVNGEIGIWWKNVSPRAERPKYLLITLEITCWDSKGRCHQTRYKFMTMEPLTAVAMADEIAPGVALYSRTTVARPVWLLKLFAKGRRFSGLDRLRSWKKARTPDK